MAIDVCGRCTHFRYDHQRNTAESTWGKCLYPDCKCHLFEMAPMLGLATTSQLIEELRARVEVGRAGRDQQDTLDALGWLRGFEGRLTPEELAYRTANIT